MSLLAAVSRRRTIRTTAIAAFLVFGVAHCFADAAYDPLAVGSTATQTTLDLVVHDEKRARDISVLIYLPEDRHAPAPVVLFSHGLGGSRKGYVYLGEQWAERGYVVVMMQHAGTDNAVWEGKPVPEALAAMRAAVNPENWRLRAGDEHAALDQLARWNSAEGHPLKGRLDLAHIGMAGHSFGASTTQTAGGESFPYYRDTFRDERIKAAIAMSPGPSLTGDNAGAFGRVAIPWMLMTGSEDKSPFGIGDTTAESRLGVYGALPPGEKYELVLDRAEHGAFSDHALPGERARQNPNHHRAVLALSTAFWDAYLRADPAAKNWLDGDGPRTVLEAADRWERK